MILLMCVVFFKQKTAYEMRISDWSSDVCSSDLLQAVEHAAPRLSLGRGLRIPCAAALADLAWAWISAHLPHGASTRAKKLHTLALGPIRKSDLAQQHAPIGARLSLLVAVTILVTPGREADRRRMGIEV